MVLQLVRFAFNISFQYYIMEPCIYVEREVWAEHFNKRHTSKCMHMLVNSMLACLRVVQCTRARAVIKADTYSLTFFHVLDCIVLWSLLRFIFRNTTLLYPLSANHVISRDSRHVSN